MKSVFDTNRTIGLRQNLIDELTTYFQRQGYTHYQRILDAIQMVPRHRFVPEGFETIAYENKPVLIDRDQTMSQPLTVALQTYYLGINKEDKVLEIGTGSGYQAAVLSHLCKEVFTLERHRILHEKSSAIFKELGIKNIHAFLQDGFEGLPKNKPYQKILVTCGAPEIPMKLVDQLAEGGIMLIPLDNEDGEQDMIRIIKTHDGSIIEESLGKFIFVPMLKGIA